MHCSTHFNTCNNQQLSGIIQSMLEPIVNLPFYYYFCNIKFKIGCPFIWSRNLKGILLLFGLNPGKWDIKCVKDIHQMCEGHSLPFISCFCKRFPFLSIYLFYSEHVSCRAGSIEVHIRHMPLLRKWDLFISQQGNYPPILPFFVETDRHEKGHTASCLLVSRKKEKPVKASPLTWETMLHPIPIFLYRRNVALLANLLDFH